MFRIDPPHSHSPHIKPPLRSLFRCGDLRVDGNFFLFIPRAAFVAAMKNNFTGQATLEAGKLVTRDSYAENAFAIVTHAFADATFVRLESA